MSKQQFQTEVSQLLELIVHSLYSHPEIFLRELISNSSDALDKLRHLSLTDDKHKVLVGNDIDSPRIDLELDEASKTLTISDTGIGMNEEDLVPPTILRSTRSSLPSTTARSRKVFTATSLIARHSSTSFASSPLRLKDSPHSLKPRSAYSPSRRRSTTLRAAPSPCFATRPCLRSTRRRV
jgi:Histidine kinase-, DNA gyrase B-, and HSP90-like ATPase